MKTETIDLEKITKKYSKRQNLDLSILEEIGNERTIQIENNKIKNISESNAHSYKITSYYKNKGITNLISNNLNDKTIQKAIKSSKNSKNLKYFYGLPQRNEFNKNPRIIQSQLENTDLEEIHKVIQKLLKSRKANISEGDITIAIKKTKIANTRGLYNEDKNSYFFYSIGLSNKNKNLSFSNIERKQINLIKELEQNESLLKTYSSKEIEKPKKISLLVFDIEPFSELLSYAFLDNFHYDNIEDNLSFLSKSNLENKKNQDIQFNKSLTITDSGTLKYGIQSSKFDTEGVTKSEHDLIKKGKVNSYLFNYNAAKHYGYKPSGNASYSSISENNILLKSKKLNKDELFNQGFIFIEEITGAHTANETTTEFSILVSKSRWISNKETKPLKPFMINSSMIKMFQNIKGTINFNKFNIEDSKPKQNHSMNIYSDYLIFDLNDL